MYRSTAVVILVFGVGCVYPTERSSEITVEIDPVPGLLEGEIYELSARVSDPAGNTIPDVKVVFGSDRATVATVTPEGILLATGVGTATVTATAVSFAGAQVGALPIEIKNVITIDSLRPHLARYGDTIQVFGAGLSPERIFAPTFNGVAESPQPAWQPFDPDRPNRFGILRLWVAPPAPRDSRVVVIGLAGTAVSPDSVRVIREDIYEPNDTLPWDFGTLQADVSNPALAFELRPREGSVPVDWYRFTQTAGDRTIIVRSQQVGPESYAVFLTNALTWNSAKQAPEVGPNGWTIVRGGFTCRGVEGEFAQFPSDSTVIALKNPPPGNYDVLGLYTFVGGYELGLRRGYHSVLPPDADEENDFCDLAKPLTIGQQKNLTIDNPHDADWFEFTVAPPGIIASFDIQTDANANALIQADVDIYIYRDHAPDSLPLVGGSQIGGETDGASVALTAGHYYLLVVDFAGVATQYTLTSAIASTPGSRFIVNPAKQELGTSNLQSVITRAGRR